MKTKTKCSLSSEQILSIIRKHIDPAADVGTVQELTDGWFNTAYAVEISHPKSLKVVLKVSPPPGIKILSYEQGAMQLEVFVYNLLHDHAHIPIPKILAVDFTRTIINNDFFLMEFLPGLPLNKLKPRPAPLEYQAIAKQIADVQFALNQLTNTEFGTVLLENRANTIREKGWFAAFRTMLNNLLNDLQRFNLNAPIDPSHILRQLDLQQAAFELVTQPRLVHWDLWEGNIFVEKQCKGYKITGITDFERSFWGDPLFEVFFMWPKRYPEVVKKYESEFGVNFLNAPAARVRRLWYNLYLYIIWLLETESRGYPFIFRVGLRLMTTIKMRKDFQRLGQIDLSK